MTERSNCSKPVRIWPKADLCGDSAYSVSEVLGRQVTSIQSQEVNIVILHRAVGSFVFVALLAIYATAQAQSIQNLTTGQYVFYDNYSGVSSVSTVPAPDTTGSYKPGPAAIIGSWITNLDSTIESSQVTNSTTAPDPGGFAGANYLRLYRDTSNEGGSVIGKVSAPITTTGQTVEERVMVYIPAATDTLARAEFMMLGTTTGSGTDYLTSPAFVYSDGSGGVKAVIGDGNGGSQVAIETGLQYQTNVWQEWDLTYTIGSTTFSVTVGGQTVSGLNSLKVGSVGGTQFSNGNDTPGGSVYYDSVKGINILPGDFNQDGKVNLTDYSILTSHWLQTGVSGANGDLNGDGTVNITDFSLFKQDYIAANGAGANALTAVPEPGTLVLIVAALPALFALGRRKK
ncbi:MAG TPA: dockerin type I repeat-containing protein [Pirellulales bacterium]|nr:dockerin type I repeat-containing protein [Pirellulales bacterium]